MNQAHFIFILASFIVFFLKGHLQANLTHIAKNLSPIWAQFVNDLPFF